VPRRSHCGVPSSPNPTPTTSGAGLPFVHTLRARFAETDAMGIVHHGSYATWFEAARVEFLRACGHPYESIRASGVDFAVVELTIAYERPVRFDDVVEIAVTVPSATRATFDMAYVATVDGVRCATGRSRHAAVGPTGRPKRLPAWVREQVSAVLPAGNPATAAGSPATAAGSPATAAGSPATAAGPTGPRPGASTADGAPAGQGTWR
jgi:acyl-CoA thioester hydrolase